MQLDRISVPFEDESDAYFILHPSDMKEDIFKRQFYCVYRIRIKTIQPRLEAKARTQLGNFD